MRVKQILCALAAAGFLTACSSGSDSSNPSATAPSHAGSSQSASAPASTAGAPAAPSSQALPEVVKMADRHHFSPDITADDFVTDVKVLGSDAFGGRKPGSPGATLTTNYLIAQFKRMGLQPGNHGQWLQAVPVVSTELTNTDVTLDMHAGQQNLPFAYRKDMIVATLQGKPKVSLDKSDVVFVGYGIDDPAQHWNDYKGVDVKGKTVVVLVNDPGYASGNPKLFKGRTMTYYGRWTYKYEEAARQGAAACLIVHATGAAGYPWSVVKNSWSGPQFDLPSSEDPAPRLPVAGWLTGDAARALFKAAGKSFDQLAKAAGRRGFKPVQLDATASITLDSRIGHFQSHNVLAKVPGSQYPDEAVIYSAHWDHLGTDPSLQGDQIYNGAVDNGTGVAALLELAGKFAAQKPAPKRSVLFAAVTLEESGLLGSKYYAAHPVFALDKTVADINMDALAPIGRAHNITVVGLGQSQLDDYLKAAVAMQNRHLSGEDSPEKGFYFRSDHFSFAKAGVPALDVESGEDLLEGGMKAGRAASADYTAHRYHTPADEYSDSWKLGGIIEDVQALYDVGHTLSDKHVFPAWSRDSAFRAKRVKMMQHSSK
ncbi:M28 family metallopeptidase [Oleiagrimonas sp. C23AA]|uniref:M28 family metallopeptidase n=1 Tax=Oleiagrimonas sp. C23AA TaxID=2719047 RepID=UPI0014241FB3|nr:M28 family metallopeptidase [Oleiagrimonas sp. C23AA]NII10887.1 M28 family peptidase [Oleiagrimonas sp. C23AA]